MTMNDPNQEDYREEHRIVNTGATTMEQQVVENVGAERYSNVSRVTSFVWLLFGILEALIALRVVLKLIAANPGSAFAALVYQITDLFLWPFSGITITPSSAGFTLDIPAIIGMIVYLFVGWVIVRLIWVLFYHPGSKSVQTYRRDRY